MSKFLNRVGEKYVTNEGYNITIISYNGCKDCTIRFEDDTIVEGVSYALIKKGAVRNKNKVSIYGVGYHGYGKYKGTDSNNKEEKMYGTWRGMLRRCYYKPHIEQHTTYKGCEVAEEWHNFQNFAKWFEENWQNYMDNSWSLDKDILVKGNKVYSPENCCFVPIEINNIFVYTNLNKIPKSVKKVGKKFQSTVYIKSKGIYLGTFDTFEEAFQVYKTEKEKYIKEVADKWKGKIDDRVYEAMYNFSINVFA